MHSIWIATSARGLGRRARIAHGRANSRCPCGPERSSSPSGGLAPGRDPRELRCDPTSRRARRSPSGQARTIRAFMRRRVRHRQRVGPQRCLVVPASAPGRIAGRFACDVLAPTTGFATCIQAVTSRRTCRHAHIRDKRKSTTWLSGSARAPNLPIRPRAATLEVQSDASPGRTNAGPDVNPWFGCSFSSDAAGEAPRARPRFPQNPTGAAHAHSRPRPCR